MKGGLPITYISDLLEGGKRKNNQIFNMDVRPSTSKAGIADEFTDLNITPSTSGACGGGDSLRRNPLDDLCVLPSPSDPNAGRLPQVHIESDYSDAEEDLCSDLHSLSADRKTPLLHASQVSRRLIIHKTLYWYCGHPSISYFDSVVSAADVIQKEA